MLDKEVYNAIINHKLVEIGESVVVGVSGGPDSVCLLHVLGKLAQPLSIKLFAVHINHMLRGEESEQDEEYVVKLCEELNIPLVVKSVDIKEMARKRGMSLEEAGREARYRQFELCADKVGAAKIAVAHNRNDQSETVIMHILRGTGLDGLKGMDYKRGRIIRPLLAISRAEIENYCRENSISPRIDSSNLIDIYTRNKVRLDLIPYIDGLFEIDIGENINKLSFLVRDEVDFIEEFASKAYNQCVIKKENCKSYLNMQEFDKNHSAVKRRILRTAIKNIKGDLKGIEFKSVESIIELASKRKTGTQVHLPGKISAEIVYDTLVLSAQYEKEKTAAFERPVNIPGITAVEELEASLEAEIVEKTLNAKTGYTAEKDALIQFFDYEKLKTGINIRNRREGDIFKPLKSNGTKKLKEYFIDNKVPRGLRDNIPLVTKNNEVIWIIGYKISDKFKVTENTKSVLKLEYCIK